MLSCALAATFAAGPLAAADATAAATTVSPDRPAPTLAGVYRAAGATRGDNGEPLARELRATALPVPLGIPTELSLAAERDNRIANEEKHTAAVKVRLALPGFLGDTVTATVTSLLVPLPADLLDSVDVGPAKAPRGGPAWPDTEATVTLRRLVDTVAGENGRHGTAFNLYESEKTILLVADPRATAAYRDQLQGKPETAGATPKVDTEAAQCRRCQLPEYLTKPDGTLTDDIQVVELFAGGPYLRVMLDLDKSPAEVRAFFAAAGEGYPVPAAVYEVAGWADDVPSPAQVSLAEPVSSPALWSPGEAGVAASLVSGESLYSTVDHSVTGRALGFTLARSYRSGVLSYNPLGAAGWTANLFAHLRENKVTREVTYHDGSGRAFRFYPKAPAPGAPSLPGGGVDGDFWALANAYDLGKDRAAGEYWAPKGLYVTLRQLDNGAGWEMVGVHNDVMTFDSQGRLVQLADRFRQRAPEDQPRGNRVRLYYGPFGRLARVADDYNRSYYFSYDEDPASPTFGLLDEVEDFAGRTITYHHGGASPRALARVEYPEVEAEALFPATAARPDVVYGYETVHVGDDAFLHGPFDRHRLATYRMSDHAEDRVTLSYRDDGRLSTAKMAEVALSWLLDWGPAGASQTPVKNVRAIPPWAHATDYEVHTTGLNRGRLKSVTEESTPVFVDVRPDGTPSTTSASPATAVEYEPDGSGRVKTVTLPDNGVVSYTYHSGWRAREAMVETVTRADGPGKSATGLTTTFHLGDDNLVASVLDPGQREQLVAPAVAGGTVERGFSQESVFNQLTFTPSGLPSEIAIGGAGSAEKVTLTYDMVTDGGGGSVDGYLKTITDPTGGTTTLAYDSAGNPTQATRTGGRTTEDFRATCDSWDRPYTTTEGSGGNALTVTRKYDLGGRLRKEIRNQSGIGTVTTTYDYNDRDQLTDVHVDNLADADGHLRGEPVTVRSYEYDGAEGLLTAVRTPEGRDVTFHRDDAGRVDEVVLPPANGQAEGTRLRRAFDEMGRVAFSADGEQGWSVTRYNRLGQLDSRTTSDGGETTYRYDAAGDLDSTTYRRRGLDVLTTYDLTSYGTVKTVTEMGLPGGARTTTIDRDTRARVTGVTRAGRSELSVEYDPTTGRPHQMTDAAGHLTTFSYDHADFAPDRVTSTVPGVAAVTTLGYDSRNRMTTVSRSDNFSLQVQLDEVGNVLRQDVHGAHPDSTTYRWDAVSKLRREDRLSAGIQTTIGYDRNGFPLQKLVSSANGVEATSYVPDAQGNLMARTRPGLSTERFSYHPDGTVKLYASPLTSPAGKQLELGYGYDPVNRLLESWVNNPEDFADPQAGLARLTDKGDVYDYDGLGRLLMHGRRTNDMGTGDAALDPLSLVSYTYAEGDPRPLPATETIGQLAALWPSSPEQVRTWDQLDRLASLTGPGSSLTVDSFGYDLLDHRTSVTTPGASFNATYRWAGQYYLGHDAGQVTQTRAYTPEGLLDTLTTDWGGARLGGLQYEWEPTGAVKKARTVMPEGSLFDALGWEWEVDAVERLREASSGALRWSYGIEGADDLVTLVNHLNELERRVPGPNGRTDEITRTTAEGTTTESLGFDTMGRRTRDARHAYTWSWRGELDAVESLATGDTIGYAYDANGRLLTRTHANEAVTFLAKTAFVWNGWEMMTQVGLNHADEPLWQVEELPGPVGLDDAPQLRVTSHMHPSDSSPEATRIFDLVRDEMGSVVAVLEDVASTPPRLKARVQYDPYGQAHVEVGPELRSVGHDASQTVVNGTPQASMADGPADDPITGIAGSLVITTSIELDATTVASSLTLARWDAATGDYLPLGGSEIALAVEGEVTHLMPVAGWWEGERYRLTLGSGITDTYGRSFVPPAAGSALTFAIPDEVTGLHDPLPGLPVDEPIHFDTATAAAATFDCRATPADAFEPCFPGGLSFLFQGAWADPTTGIAYHRHRWYESRTQAWLSRDPEGNVDSENLYSLAAWGPHAATDPMGLEAICTAGIEVNTEVDPGGSGSAILGVGDALHNMTLGQIRSPEETLSLNLILLFDAMNGFKLTRHNLVHGVVGNWDKLQDCIDAGDTRCASEAFTELGLTVYLVGRGATSGISKSLSSMPGVQVRWLATNEGPVFAVVTTDAQAALAVEGALADAGISATGVFMSGIEPVEKGKEGEKQAGISGKKQKIPSLSGKRTFRVPDELTEVSLREIKNVAKQSNTSQLRDFLAHCQQEGLTFILETRPTTRISGPLQDLIDQGLIEHRYIGG